MVKAIVKNKKVRAYTDGGCSPNPGIGGWGAVLIYGYNRPTEELSGGAKQTTNNRMEMTAAIRALERIKGDHLIDMYTDSKYVMNGVTKWSRRWRHHGWCTAAGEPVKNVDLWRRLCDLADRRSITWYWVKGHSGNVGNERADALASAEIFRRKYPKK